MVKIYSFVMRIPLEGGIPSHVGSFLSLVLYISGRVQVLYGTVLYHSSITSHEITRCVQCLQVVSRMNGRVQRFI